MQKLSQQVIDEFLASRTLCRLGCLDDEGYPYVVPCSYMYADGGFYVTPRQRSAWGHYLHRDGRVSLCIDFDYGQPRVQVKGIAELLEGPRLMREPFDDDPMFALSLRMLIQDIHDKEEARAALLSFRDEPWSWFFVRPSRMIRAGDWTKRSSP